MVTIKNEPPSPAAAAASSSGASSSSTTKRKRGGGGPAAAAASAAAAVAIKTEAPAEEGVAVKVEVKRELRGRMKAAAAEDDGDDSSTLDGLPTLGKLKASWQSLDCKSTATEESPYPKLARPHPVECFFVNDALSALHGEPIKKELEEGCSGKGTLLEKRAQSVLDSLVRTILSQNTTDKLSAQAFAQLKQAFPTWKAALAAPAAKVEAAIKIGGLAQIKWGRIRVILETLLAERPQDCPGGEPSLEWLRELSTEEVKAELGRFKGVGPKTISCVLMFTIGSPHEFPVDTHVWHIAKRLGWVPPSAGREEAYAHLNSRVPDAVKYTLHVLLVRHGKACRACSKGALQLPEIEGPCPLTPLASGGKLRQQLVALAEELGGNGEETGEEEEEVAGKGKKKKKAKTAGPGAGASKKGKAAAVAVKKEVV